MDFEKTNRNKLTSIFLIVILFLNTFLSGCTGAGDKISVSVTPREVKPGETILISIQAPESTKVRVTIKNEESGYAKTVYKGATKPDGSLELSIPILPENIEKKLGRNIVIVEALGGLHASTSFVITGTAVSSILSEVPIQMGNWNPQPSKIAELQKELIELAYLFTEAEIVTNSVVYIDNQKMPYKEFKKRLNAAIDLWGAVENKAKKVESIAKSLTLPSAAMKASSLDGSESHQLKVFETPFSLYATSIQAQIAGGTIDIQACARDKRIAEIVQKFAPKIGKSAAERRAHLMWWNEQIQDEAAYKAKFYDTVYKVLLGLETAGKIAEGVIGLYCGYTGLLKAKTVGEQAFRLGTLILTEFGVVYSLTKQGVKIYAGGTISKEAYAVFTPGDYINEGLGIIGLATGKLSDPDNIVYIAGKVGNMISPVSGEIGEMIQMDLDVNQHKLVILSSKIPKTSPWSSYFSQNNLAPNLFLPGYYVLPTGKHIQVKKISPTLIKNLQKTIPNEYLFITPEGEIGGGVSTTPEKGVLKFSGIKGLRNLHSELKSSDDPSAWIKATLKIRVVPPQTLSEKDFSYSSKTNKASVSNDFLRKIKLKLILSVNGVFKGEFNLWASASGDLKFGDKSGTVEKTISGDSVCSRDANFDGKSLKIKCSIALQTDCYNRMWYHMCGGHGDKVDFEIIYRK